MGCCFMDFAPLFGCPRGWPRSQRIYENKYDTFLKYFELIHIYAINKPKF